MMGRGGKKLQGGSKSLSFNDLIYLALFLTVRIYEAGGEGAVIKWFPRW